MWLFIAFLSVPLIEIALFIQVGGLIGLWPTLAIVALTAVLGTSLVRNQGRVAMGNLRSSFERLDDPSEPLAHGAMILVAGALLLTPGFFTDAIGFSFLIPSVRHRAFVWAKSRMTMARFTMGGMHQGPGGGAGHPHQQSRTHHQPQDDGVIDGEFTEIPGDKKPTHSPSGWTRH